MSPEHLPPDHAQEWFNRARSSLLQASAVQPGVYLEDLCFQAQQAVEKAFKALLLHRHVRFPYVHDLGELIRLLEKSGQTVPQTIRLTARLSDFAVAARYPGTSEPVTREEYDECLVLATKALRWVEELLVNP